jgi:hypothetical protein
MDDPISNFFKSMANTIVGGGVKAYGAIADRSQMPSNKRLYLETFADENRMPITEKNFTEAELKTIGDLIKAKQLANPNAQTGYIQYKDYLNFVPPSQNSMAAGVGAGTANPYENIRTSLGQFNYAIDPKTGNVSVKDVYDFNPIKSKLQQRMSTGDYIPNAPSVYGLARMYGEAMMPEGSGKGRPVQIQIPGLLGR